MKALTVAQVAQDWGVDRDTIYRLIHTGKLKAFKVGSDWRITQKALEDYIRQGEREAYNPAPRDTGRGQARNRGRWGGRGDWNDIEYCKRKMRVAIGEDTKGKSKTTEATEDPEDIEAWVKRQLAEENGKEEL